MRREHLRDYTLVSTPIGAIISLRDEATRKIIARYLITYRLREALTQAILDLKKQYPDPYVTPEIRLPDTERFLWNFYYHCLYEEGKITCKQLAEYIFNYKVAVHYSIRAEYNFSYRHKTYYEGIDYHFTAIAPVCIDLDDTNELFNLAVNDAYTRLGFMINGKFNFNHEGHISTPTIISAQIVGHPTLGKLVNKKNTFKLDARQEDF
jgi:hypothetical protein